MPVVVQHLHISWGKSGRGSPGATVRNALPRALPLVPSSAVYIYQHHSFFERAGSYDHHLVEECELDRLPRASRFLEHSLRPSGVLSVGICWHSQMGLPRRRAQRDALLLRLGETARIVANGRHVPMSGEGTWSYTRDIFNIGLVEVVTEELFVRANSPVLLNFEADLY